MKIVVNLVSDQTIPNVLFIKEMSNADSYIFISTSKMESRSTSKNIAQSANLSDKSYSIIEVQEDSLIDIEIKLQESLSFEDEDEIFVNITGGTKIMSLGVFNFFARLGSAKIFYLPIGKNELLQTFPLKKNTTSSLNARVTLEEYLKAYGVSFNSNSFSNKNSLVKEYNITENIFSNIINGNKERFFSITELVRTNNFRNKVINKDKNDLEAEIFNKVQELKTLGLKLESENFISKHETKYLTGDWFEEFVYYNIKKYLEIPDENIGLGVQLIKNETPNEYDIIYTHNNALHVIECKTDISDSYLGEEEKISYLFTSTLYKAATLKKEFGLWVNYYLFTLNDFSKLTDVQKKRASSLNIKLAGIETLNNINSFKEYISNMK